MATETYELRVHGMNDFSYRETVLHFSGVGVASADTLAAGESLISGWIANLETLWLATLPDSYSVIEYQARRTTPKPSAVAQQNFTMQAVPGVRTGPSIGQQLCPVMFLIPTMGTKSGGKIFWPAMAKGDVVTNAYLAAWKTAASNWFVAAKAGFTQSGITWTIVIFSRKLQTTSVATNAVFSPVFGFLEARRVPPGGRSRKKRHHP